MAMARCCRCRHEGRVFSLLHNTTALFTYDVTYEHPNSVLINILKKIVSFMSVHSFGIHNKNTLLKTNHRTSLISPPASNTFYLLVFQPLAPIILIDFGTHSRKSLTVNNTKEDKTLLVQLQRNMSRQLQASFADWIGIILLFVSSYCYISA